MVGTVEETVETVEAIEVEALGVDHHLDLDVGALTDLAKGGEEEVVEAHSAVAERTKSRKISVMETTEAIVEVETDQMVMMTMIIRMEMETRVNHQTLLHPLYRKEEPRQLLWPLQL